MNKTEYYRRLLSLGYSDSEAYDLAGLLWERNKPKNDKGEEITPLAKEILDSKKALDKLGNTLKTVGTVGMLAGGIPLMLLNPAATIGGIAGGSLVDNIVQKFSPKDELSLKPIYNNWGEMMHGVTGIPTMLGEFTNPGVIAGAPVAEVGSAATRMGMYLRKLPQNVRNAYFKDMKQSIMNLIGVNNKTSNAPFILNFDNAENSTWYKGLAHKYGQEQADLILATMRTPEFAKYFVGDNSEQVARDISDYNKAMDVFSKLAGDPEHGMGVLQGSAAISGDGSIIRKSAVPHDLDFKAHIQDAANTSLDVTDKEAVRDNLRILWSNEDGALTQAPIIQRVLREFGRKPYIFMPKGMPKWFTPKSKDNAIYVTRMWGIGDPYGAHRVVLTDVNGIPVDFFLTNNKIYTNSHVTGLGSAHEPLYWKRKWVQENKHKRPKDILDLNYFEPFSESNPIIDVSTGETLYSPFRFGKRIVTKENYPVVNEVETYPGSGIKVPVTMNTKGEFMLVAEPLIDPVLLMESFLLGGILGQSLKNAVKSGAKKVINAAKAFKLSRAIEEEAKKTPVRQELPYITYGKRIQTNNRITHMGRAVKGADIVEPNEFRKSVYDEYGLDDIPLAFDSSKGDVLNYLSRHLSRLRDRGIDYSDISLFPVSKSPIPKDPIKRQAILDGNNMAAVNSKKTIIVSDDPSKTKNLGFMISHEIDHIKNPTYNDLLQSQDFVRKFFNFTDSELKLTLGDTPRLKITDAEVLARGSLIKDYLGFTSANLQMTSKLLQQAVKEYPKETGSDNLTKFFSRVKDWEGLTEFINKYATGIVPISIGYYASESSK